MLERQGSLDGTSKEATGRQQRRPLGSKMPDSELLECFIKNTQTKIPPKTS